MNATAIITSEYIANGKTVHFKLNYNKSPTLLIYNILRNMDTLIFDHNNGDEYDYGDASMFNKPIDLPPTIRILELGYSFNRPIVLTSCMEKLTFGCKFNQQIILTPCIKILIFSVHFDKYVRLSKRILRLIFKSRFNQPIDLSKSIVYLVFGNNFNRSISLGKKIRHLTLGYSFVQPLVLTKNMLSFTYASRSQYPYILSPCITHLILACNNHSIRDHIPDSVKSIVMKFPFLMPINSVLMSIDNMPQSVEKINNLYRADIFG